MSYYDDWIAPFMFDVEEYIAEKREKEDEAVSRAHLGWTTADSEFITYGKMTTGHLLNCRRMIERKNGWRRMFLPYINAELHRRGVTSR